MCDHRALRTPSPLSSHEFDCRVDSMRGPAKCFREAPIKPANAVVLGKAGKSLERNQGKIGKKLETGLSRP